MSGAGMDRKTALLMACRDMLIKCRDSMETTIFYDEADCDGYCLLNDIESELEDCAADTNEQNGHSAQQTNTAIALLKQWAEYCEAGGVNADHQLCQATIEFAGQHQ